MVTSSGFSKTPFVWHLRCDVIPKNLITFASEMYIKAQKKWRKSEDGSVMVPSILVLNSGQSVIFARTPPYVRCLV